MQKKLRDKDVQCGLLTIALGVIGWLYTHATIETANSLVASGIAASFYPKCLWGALALCGVILLYQGFIRTEEEQVPFPRTDWKAIFITFALMLAYAYLLEFVGFIAGSIIFIAAFMLYLGERKPLSIALTAVLGSVGVWALFDKLFMIPLPAFPFL